MVPAVRIRLMSLQALLLRTSEHFFSVSASSSLLADIFSAEACCIPVHIDACFLGEDRKSVV